MTTGWMESTKRQFSLFSFFQDIVVNLPSRLMLQRHGIVFQARACAVTHTQKYRIFEMDTYGFFFWWGCLFPFQAEEEFISQSVLNCAFMSFVILNSTQTTKRKHTHCCLFDHVKCCAPNSRLFWTHDRRRINRIKENGESTQCIPFITYCRRRLDSRFVCVCVCVSSFLIHRSGREWIM